MRLDKFLKISRLIKRRTVANSACSAGRIFLNGKAAKAGAQVKEGDIIEIHFGSRDVRAKVEALTETTRKEDADKMYTLL